MPDVPPTGRTVAPRPCAKWEGSLAPPHHSANPTAPLPRAFRRGPARYPAGDDLCPARRPVETKVVERADPLGDWADLEDIRDAFLNTIHQVPPMYSAVKVDGERLYEKARRGETVERAPRQVQIHQLEFTEWAPPVLSLRVECSKGTYVRGLARGLGEALGVGAHLTALRRTTTREFTVEHCWSMALLVHEGAGGHVVLS
ncbi:MAG: hypothetical protein BRD41_02890 [Bacteroidetes bacterium QS_1_63_11]|nr:MAG: hypothetical protein BRD41_02890 [Bacteroidetes bacterium QS_1_63_11]